LHSLQVLENKTAGFASVKSLNNQLRIHNPFEKYSLFELLICTKIKFPMKKNLNNLFLMNHKWSFEFLE